MIKGLGPSLYSLAMSMSLLHEQNKDDYTRLPLNKNIKEINANNPNAVVTIPSFLERIQPDIASNTLKSSIPNTNNEKRYECFVFPNSERSS